MNKGGFDMSESPSSDTCAFHNSQARYIREVTDARLSNIRSHLTEEEFNMKLNEVFCLLLKLTIKTRKNNEILSMWIQYKFLEMITLAENALNRQLAKSIVDSAITNTSQAQYKSVQALVNKVKNDPLIDKILAKYEKVDTIETHVEETDNLDSLSFHNLEIFTGNFTTGAKATASAHSIKTKRKLKKNRSNLCISKSWRRLQKKVLFPARYHGGRSGRPRNNLIDPAVWNVQDISKPIPRDIIEFCNSRSNATSKDGRDTDDSKCFWLNDNVTSATNDGEFLHSFETHMLSTNVKENTLNENNPSRYEIRNEFYDTGNSKLKRHASSEDTYETWFISNINEPSTSKGVRHSHVDVQCGTDKPISLSPYDPSLTESPLSDQQGMRTSESMITLIEKPILNIDGRKSNSLTRSRLLTPLSKSQGIVIKDEEDNNSLTEMYSSVDEVNTECLLKKRYYNSSSNSPISSPGKASSPLILLQGQSSSSPSRFEGFSNLSCDRIRVSSFTGRRFSNGVIFHGSWQKFNMSSPSTNRSSSLEKNATAKSTSNDGLSVQDVDSLSGPVESEVNVKARKVKNNVRKLSTLRVVVGHKTLKKVPSSTSSNRSRSRKAGKESNPVRTLNKRPSDYSARYKSRLPVPKKQISTKKIAEKSNYEMTKKDKIKNQPRKKTSVTSTLINDVSGIHSPVNYSVFRNDIIINDKQADCQTLTDNIKDNSQITLNLNKSSLTSANSITIDCNTSATKIVQRTSNSSTKNNLLSPLSKCQSIVINDEERYDSHPNIYSSFDTECLNVKNEYNSFSKSPGSSPEIADSPVILIQDQCSSSLLQNETYSKLRCDRIRLSSFTRRRFSNGAGVIFNGSWQKINMSSPETDKSLNFSGHNAFDKSAHNDGLSMNDQNVVSVPLKSKLIKTPNVKKEIRRLCTPKVLVTHKTFNKAPSTTSSNRSSKRKAGKKTKEAKAMKNPSDHGKLKSRLPVPKKKISTISKKLRKTDSEINKKDILNNDEQQKEMSFVNSLINNVSGIYPLNYDVFRNDTVVNDQHADIQTSTENIDGSSILHLKNDKSPLTSAHSVAIDCNTSSFKISPPSTSRKPKSRPSSPNRTQKKVSVKSILSDNKENILLDETSISISNISYQINNIIVGQLSTDMNMLSDKTSSKAFTNIETKSYTTFGNNKYEESNKTNESLLLRTLSPSYKNLHCAYPVTAIVNSNLQYNMAGKNYGQKPETSYNSNEVHLTIEVNESEKFITEIMHDCLLNVFSNKVFCASSELPDDDSLQYNNFIEGINSGSWPLVECSEIGSNDETLSDEDVTSFKSATMASRISEYYLTDTDLNANDDTLSSLGEIQNPDLCSFEAQSVPMPNIDINTFDINAKVCLPSPRNIDPVNSIDSETGSRINPVDATLGCQELPVLSRSSNSFISVELDDEAALPEWLFNLNTSQDTNREQTTVVIRTLDPDGGEPLLDANANNIVEAIGISAGAGDGRGIHSDQSRDSSGRGSTTTSSSDDTSSETDVESVISDPAAFTSQYQRLSEPSSTEQNNSDIGSPLLTTSVPRTNLPVESPSGCDADISSIDTDT